MGKALYRKYRPISLSTVIGQDSVIKPLSEAIKSGTFSHAYIFTGPRGCGKTSVARIFAHEINGFKYELEDSYVDIIEIDAASNTGVDNIRDLREKAMVAPTEGKYKVYIIDEVHMLSRSAFNALLKIMEEPPKHVIFVLATTNLEKVPVTITSRAQIYNFKLADNETMFNHLKSIAEKESIKIDDDALKIIVRRGGGSFRDSISLLDQISNLKQKSKTITTSDIDTALGLPADEKLKKLLESFESGDNKTTTEILKDFLNSGTTAEVLASDIITRIIENPTAKSLKLVEKLFNVQYPFADAKLLVAFLETENFVPSQVAPQVVLATTPTKPIDSDAEKRRTEFMERIERSKAEMKKRQEASRLEEATKEEYSTTSLTDSIVQDGNLNIKAFIKDIKELNKGLGTTLEKSKFILSDKEVKIYPKSSIIGVLRSKKNLDVLKKNAPGFYINIIDTTEEKIPKEAFSVTEEVEQKPISKNMQKKIDAISDIMGKGIQIKEEDNADTF
jgi:DNA polymerase-3 subunit gamma/tau